MLDDDDEYCPACGNGDKVPSEGYWICPACDREWSDDENDLPPLSPEQQAD